MFEDASLSADAKVNVSLAEKHLHTDTNALDFSNDVPNPTHSYVRDHPYYRSITHLAAPIASLNQISDLQSHCSDDVRIQSQPLSAMFANMHKFDLLPNLADTQDFTHSYDLPMHSCDRSVGSMHNSIINNDITMAYSAPAVNFNNRTNGNSRSYASVAAAPPSNLSVPHKISVSNLNVADGLINYSRASFDSKKGASISKKSVSRGAPLRPPLPNYKLHSLEPVPELASDLEDSDIELVDDSVGSVDYEYLDLGPLHFKFNYNNSHVELYDFLVPSVLMLVADLVGFDYVSPRFVALQQSLEARLLALASSLHTVAVPCLVDAELNSSSVALKSHDAEHDTHMIRNIGVSTIPVSRDESCEQKSVQIIPHFIDSDEDEVQQSRERLDLLAEKPSQELTVAEDLMLFEAQELKEQQCQQQHSLRAVIDDMDDSNINEYGDLDVTAAFLAQDMMSKLHN